MVRLPSLMNVARCGLLWGVIERSATRIGVIWAVHEVCTKKKKEESV